MSTTTKIATFAAILALGGCKSPQDKIEEAESNLRDSKQEAAEGDLKEAREEIKEAREDLREAKEELREEQGYDPAARAVYVTRVEADLARIDRELAALEARARATGVEMKQDLREAQTALQARINRFKTERWEETKGDVKAAMDEIDRELLELRGAVQSNLQELEKGAPGTPPPS